MFYFMVIGFNLMKFFKGEVLGIRVAKGANQTNVRRSYIDFAMKVVKTARGRHFKGFRPSNEPFEVKHFVVEVRECSARLSLEPDSKNFLSKDKGT